MKLALVFAIYAAVQAASENVSPAVLFDRGVTFARFVEDAKSQREVWLKNASRTDIPPDAVNRLKHVRDGLRVLMVTEDWCVDSVHTVPYLANLATAAGVEVRIIGRAAGEPIMSAHRTRDGRPVTPTVVLLRNNRDIGAWVERPASLQQWFFAMATDPVSARLFAQRAAWYDEDRGRTTIAEFVALVEQAVRD
jgi:hypothetical protein